MKLLDNSIKFLIYQFNGGIDAILDTYKYNWLQYTENPNRFLNFFICVSIISLISIITLNYGYCKKTSLYCLCMMIIASHLKTLKIITMEFFEKRNSTFLKNYFINENSDLFLCLIISYVFLYCFDKIMQFSVLIFYLAILKYIDKYYHEELLLIFNDVPENYRNYLTIFNQPIHIFIIFAVIFFIVKYQLLQFIYSMTGSMLLLNICCISLEFPQGFYAFYKNEFMKENYKDYEMISLWFIFSIFLYFISVFIFTEKNINVVIKKNKENNE